LTPVAQDIIVFWSFIHSGHSFILAISIAPLQVLYYSEALLTTARILYRSFTPKRIVSRTVYLPDAINFFD